MYIIITDISLNYLIFFHTIMFCHLLYEYYRHFWYF